MKRTLIVVTITLLTAAIWGYIHWLNTPQYSLLKIRKSIESKDRYLFEKHVDTEHLIEEIVEDVVDFVVEEMDKSPDADSIVHLAVTRGLAAIVKPTIENAFKDAFEGFWEDEVEQIIDEADDFSGEGGARGYADSFRDLKGRLLSRLDSSEAKILYLKQAGKIAILGVETAVQTGEKRVFEFKLIKIGNYWRVSEISNFKEMLQENPLDLLN